MHHDFLVIGGGIAGASAAYALSEFGQGRVGLLERESQPGYHSTGRSAAVYTENYGNAVIRALVKGSKSFLTEPPEGFAENPILSPRGSMMFARADQSLAMDKALAFARETGVDAPEVSKEEALEIHSGLDPDYFARAMYEPGAMDIDVHGLHHGYLRALKANGGEIVTNAEVTALARNGGTWSVETRAGRFEAPVVINAAGAWADELAGLAGLAPVGLAPLRRTAITFDPPEGLEIDRWPVVIDVEEQFYFKPDAGRVLGSPADETPMPPSDVQPDELDIAHAVDRIERASRLEVRRIASKWAGLRTFAPDRTPVVGMAPEGDGFLWLAGQGGYGIKTSPALGRVAAALAAGTEIPPDIAVDPADLAPDRFFS